VQYRGILRPELQRCCQLYKVNRLLQYEYLTLLAFKFVLKVLREMYLAQVYGIRWCPRPCVGIVLHFLFINNALSSSVYIV
jgi:hypothetical protein